MHAPKLTHWQLVKRILRYLKGVLSHGLWLRCSNKLSLNGFVDVGWAFDPNNRKSTSGLCIYYGDNLVSWGLKNNLLFPSLILKLSIVVLLFLP